MNSSVTLSLICCATLAGVAYSIRLRAQAVPITTTTATVGAAERALPSNINDIRVAGRRDSLAAFAHAARPHGDIRRPPGVRTLVVRSGQELIQAIAVDVRKR